ncbi:antibiotic biosynthesis monooxygenase (plasmid) [Streptomyces coelicoflavus]|uniref:antibiotic biosynthesis monooxygenase family protein n=1 Tax=Streptomyces TaxID=1883 RepID=UPI0012911CF0|nr:MULTISPECIES: antibiotic biosynthesis monooxygenase [Streptomyces]MCX5041563.1 antibiotic biosynthesis monooxygenase [Streptomyces coelicoflavus]QFX87006.1 antibiotic biosynthesis monooxygenase [Streptomyces sp. SYP-A7193]
MPIISTEDNYLTVLNLFTTDTPEHQEQLLTEMGKIVDAATYEGWISSTVHAGQDTPGTANLIQWRSGEDLEKRYAGEEFKHRTLPVFREITTAIRLLQNEIVFSQTRPGLGDAAEVSPDRDDYTVIEVHRVGDADQAELVKLLGEGQDWLVNVPGYRSHSVFKGLRAMFVEGAFAVVYAQWDSRESYEAFRDLPHERKPRPRRTNDERIAELAVESDTNTYRVVHTRAAGE